MRIDKKSKKLSPGRVTAGFRTDDEFIRDTCRRYLERHLIRRHRIRQETLEFFFWVTGLQPKETTLSLLQGFNPQRMEELQEALHVDADDPTIAAEAIIEVLKESRSPERSRVLRRLIGILKSLPSRSTAKSALELRIARLRDLFGMKRAEVRLVTFLLIVESFTEAGDFLVDHLKCDRFRGRSDLLALLEIRPSELLSALNRLKRLEVLDSSLDQIDLCDWFRDLLLLAEESPGESHLFRPCPPAEVPLSSYPIDQDTRRHLCRLLRKKHREAIHVLFYGPPGSGKTSFARALVADLSEPAYEVLFREEATSRERRAALTACLKRTNSGKGSILLVDEADSLLNTESSWILSGETQDKGWLNHLLEEPGTRVLWITNRIEAIEESVLRRFTFSVKFQPLNRRARVGMWRHLLEPHGITTLFSAAEIEALSFRYPFSAGEIATALRGARLSAGGSAVNFKRCLQLSLDAGLQLKKCQGWHPPSKKATMEDYTTEGLNLDVKVEILQDRLRRFDAMLREGKARPLNLNLLFYGPPGSGKTALAHHLAAHIDREIHGRRYSDLQSKYVGEGERNIREAFEEAQGAEAVLLVDEIDSMLFDRDAARNSWEITFVNEFLAQMETFRGILICTTNRMTALDPAAMRRFTLKVQFDYLSAEGNLVFYRKLLEPIARTRLDPNGTAALRVLRRLVPADFARLRDRYALETAGDADHASLIRELEAESRLKGVAAGQRRIGFRGD